jgi:hypothetical protein
MSSLQILGVATILGFTIFCCIMSWVANWQSSKEKAAKQTSTSIGNTRIVQPTIQDESERVLAGT